MFSRYKEYVPAPGENLVGAGIYTVRNIITDVEVEVFALHPKTALKIAHEDLKVYKGDLNRDGKLEVVDFKPDEKTNKECS